MPTHHEINVRFDGTHTIPDLPASMAEGDTVHYSSDAGMVIILFVENGSPFLDSNGNDIQVITSLAPPLLLKKVSPPPPPPPDGGFTCRCFITLKSGMTVGWGPKSPQSGGNHVVK